jgi:hypothetical protein
MPAPDRPGSTPEACNEVVDRPTFSSTGTAIRPGLPRTPGASPLPWSRVRSLANSFLAAALPGRRHDAARRGDVSRASWSRSPSWRTPFGHTTPAAGPPSTRPWPGYRGLPRLQRTETPTRAASSRDASVRLGAAMTIGTCVVTRRPARTVFRRVSPLHRTGGAHMSASWPEPRTSHGAGSGHHRRPGPARRPPRDLPRMSHDDLSEDLSTAGAIQGKQGLRSRDRGAKFLGPAWHQNHGD